ncbi:MAG: S24 family peptidase [Bdellovibrionales bacterium]|jgi:phage repressor protein C with HTH and peptisase S24 domain
MFTHVDIWLAIDRLAESHGLTPSGLARKAGLSATLFNPSKRFHGERPRWPSTESLAAVLNATQCPLDDFVALITAKQRALSKIPLFTLTQAAHTNLFDEAGIPQKELGDFMTLPAAHDGTAFALEIDNETLEPHYSKGCRLILSPAEKPRRGEPVGVRTVQGDLFIKKLNREGVLKIELASLTAGEPPLTLPRHDIVWMNRIVWASQ